MDGVIANTHQPTGKATWTTWHTSNGPAVPNRAPSLVSNSRSNSFFTSYFLPVPKRSTWWQVRCPRSSQMYSS